jgi:hypothetical protein
MASNRSGCGVYVISLRFQEFLIEAVAAHRDQELHNRFKGQLFLSGKIFATHFHLLVKSFFLVRAQKRAGYLFDNLLLFLIFDPAY